MTDTPTPDAQISGAKGTEVRRIAVNDVPKPSVQVPTPPLSRDEKWRKGQKAAKTFWRGLVKSFDETEAREIMLEVMGAKKTGRPKTSKSHMLDMFILGHVAQLARPRGQLRAAEIAFVIWFSTPYYVESQLGRIFVVTPDWLPWGLFSEQYMSDPDDPVVRRGPLIEMSLKTIERRVQRMMRLVKQKKMFQKAQAPMQDCHD